ncbi:hypothetical protein AVEN_237937-1 [Araneus ventricosus]|uniref:Uncharacterized protein n=1 Tax=Araneus ventricosus TaxID=182803 RepID=A0A4Y2V9R7_ARAVE|nr:hypothetical protein AVEN_237937-1 [Araneus ventricosus]
MESLKERTPKKTHREKPYRLPKHANDVWSEKYSFWREMQFIWPPRDPNVKRPVAVVYPVRQVPSWEAATSSERQQETTNEEVSAQSPTSTAGPWIGELRPAYQP